MAINVFQHVFVLMLENRSFDHMLGFSGITGTDAETGQATKINGLSGSESNVFDGQTFLAGSPAPENLPADPGHEFENVLEQLCGPGATYPPGGPYPDINNSGFVASYAGTHGRGDPGDIMKCFGSDQLPVLNALAREFVVCDNWHASVPGPTWPNRIFVHAASSGGLDHSPSTAEILLWETLSGFSLPNGTIFDEMSRKGVRWRLYAGDDFPMVAALKGIQLTLVHPYHEFTQDVARQDYPASYTFIEPSYNVLEDYKCSTSQHPKDGVSLGESLIKSTYEAIRASPVWKSSLFIITWDEHGGFHDHAAPPPAAPPADLPPGSQHNQFGFTFDRYGLRVPAVVISPLIPRNLIDHRLYDHASIPATVEDAFGLTALTARDANANRLTPLASLSAARSDAPITLPEPRPATDGCTPFAGAAMRPALPALARPTESANDGNVPTILYAALRSDLALSPASERNAIMARFGAIKTRADARAFVDGVREKLAASRG
jgi:phospholipase C